MKSRRILMVLLIATMFIAQSCIALDGATFSRKRVRGSGKLATARHAISGVHGVELATNGQLEIEIGDKEELIIEAEDNLLEYFEINVRRGILEIDTRSRVNIQTRRGFRFYLMVKELDYIATSSSGDILAPDIDAGRVKIEISSSGDIETGAIDCTKLDIEISSSGDLEIEDLRAEKLWVEISSSGDVKIDGGKVVQQDISINSSGDYQGRRLESDEAEVRINSSGDATVQVNDRLYASTNSSGSIYYSGNPRVTKQTNSSGDIRRIGGSRRVSW